MSGRHHTKKEAQKERILTMLRRFGEMSVGQLSQNLDLNPTGVGNYLKELIGEDKVFKWETKTNSRFLYKIK